MHSKTQVVIIGAGPTGLSMAAQLIRYGIDFMILEKNAETTPFSKALAIQARTLEIFQELGLAEKAIEEGRLINGVNMFYKGKRKAHIDLNGLGQGLTKYSFALSLEQSKTEKLLVNHIATHGKKVSWKTEFVSYTQDESNVTVNYTTADGEQHTVTAEYLVGADGASSTVRHQAGFSFEGDTIPKIFYVTDVILNSSVVNKDELFAFFLDKGFALFFPMEGKKHYRIVGILPGKVETDNINFESVKDELNSQMVVPIEFEKDNWFSIYKIHSRRANTFMKGRCFIAGDAAHIHTPAGGQGMNTGIQDAYNLAWKIAFMITHKTRPELLETYNTERTENADHLLRTTDRFFDTLVGSNAFWNFIRVRVMPTVMNFISKNAILNKFIFLLVSQTGIGYPNSALTLKSKIGKIKAGDRMPYFVLENGHDIFDEISYSGFKALFFDEQEKGNFEILEKIKFPIIQFSFNEIPRKYFESATGFYILLRPDNHICYIGKDLEKGIGFLDKIL